jgi:hypothetical protein
MGAQWKGLDQLDALQASLTTLPQRLGEEMLTRVKARTTVRSGALRDAWAMEITSTTLTIGNPLPYATFVEMGTPKMAPVGMLGSVVMEVPQLITKLVWGTT